MLCAGHVVHALRRTIYRSYPTRIAAPRGTAQGCHQLGSSTDKETGAGAGHCRPPTAGNCRTILVRFLLRVAAGDDCLNDLPLLVQDGSSGPFPLAIQYLWRDVFTQWFPSNPYASCPGPEILRTVLSEDSAQADCELWIPVEHVPPR